MNERMLHALLKKSLAGLFFCAAKKHKVLQYLVLSLFSALFVFTTRAFFGKPNLENLCQKTDQKSINKLNE